MSSSTTYVVPQPVRLDAFRAGELDERAIDFTADLVPYEDMLDSVISVEVISRDNGGSLGPGDLTILTDDQHAPSVDSSGYIIGWWQTSTDSIASNGITVDYVITVRALTTRGRTIICDAMQLLVPLRG